MNQFLIFNKSIKNEGIFFGDFWFFTNKIIQFSSFFVGTKQLKQVTVDSMKYSA